VAETRSRRKPSCDGNGGVRSGNPRMSEDPCLHKMDGYFICDELAVLIHRLRELICRSDSHTRIAFLCSADDIFCDLLKTLDRGWTTIEGVAQALEREHQT
jgi:hypothetical protein